MAHILGIMLLAAFAIVAIHMIVPLLIALIRAPFMLIYGVWMLIYGLYCAPGAIYRGIRQDTGKTAEFSFLKNLGGAIAICAIITLLLMPLFPT